MTEQRKAIIYCRISQDREGAGLAVDRQEEDCRKLAAQLGWQVVAVHTDNDVSAYSGKRRKNYEALLVDLEAGRATGVLAWHTDRLHRSPLELERYITVCERGDVITHTVQAGELDLSTATGQLQARIAGAVARHESQHKGERVRRARLQKAQAGGWSGGVRPFGFEPDGVTIRPSEAAEIAKASDSIVSGMALRGVVRELNQRGVPTATGKTTWTAMALKDVLLRPRNAGLAKYQGEVIGKASWSPIVPEETWRAVVSILTNPDRTTNGGKGAQVRWLGSGLYLCGVCGQPTLRVGTTGQHRNPAYRCKTREGVHTTGHVIRTAPKLDDYVEIKITQRLMKPDAAKLLAPATPDGIDTTALAVEATALRQRLTDLGEAAGDGAITIAQLRTATAKVQARLTQINDDMARAAQHDPLAGLAVGTDDFGDQWFGTKPDRPDGLDLDRRRAILRSILTVTVLPAAVKPDGKPVRGPRFDRRSVAFDWQRGL